MYYQAIIANNIFSYIDGGYFETLSDCCAYVNSKLIEFKDDDYRRIENVFVKCEVDIEVRKMVGFQELISYDKENSYVVLARFNRKKCKWDRSGIYYTNINFIEYNIAKDNNYFYLLAGNVLEKNIDEINKFKDPNALKEYIAELFIYNKVDPKSIYDKMLICRNRRTIESVIKFCYDTILASNGLVSI